MFRWLGRLFDVPSELERSGATLGAEAGWEVSAPRDPGLVVRSLPLVLPPESTLYLEGGQSRDVERRLRPHAVPGTLKLALGTIWPRPHVLHVPLTTQTVELLAELLETHAQPEVCVHFHAYTGQTVLLEWYDAFSKDPFHLSRCVPEEQIRAFCERCRCTYVRRERARDP